MTKGMKIAFLVLTVVTIGSVVTAYNLNSKLKSVSAVPAADQEEVKNLVAAVGALIILPENETPTVATVSDPSKLKEQPFFNHSEVGDKVLIYSEALKAVLYRPSTGKIVEVSVLNVAPPQNDASKNKSSSSSKTSKSAE